MRSLVLVGILAAGSTAHAGTLADAITRHDDASIASLRAQHAASPDDVNLRCALGAAYGKRGDLSRADLYLDGCDTAQLDAEIADVVARASSKVTHELRDSQLSGIDVIVTAGDGGAAEIDALPGERFTVPRIVWVPAGHHVLKVWANDRTYEFPIDSQAHARGPMVLDLGKPVVAAPRTGNADFTDDNSTEAPEKGPPPDVKHPPMKIGIIDAHSIDSGGDKLEDPLIARQVSRPWRFGARLGGGVFGQTGGDARVGPAVAVMATLPLGDAIGLDLRLDWSQRGSDGADTLGFTLGPTVEVATFSPFAVRVGGGARAAVRIDDDTMATSTTAVDAAGWLEVPLARVPMTVGVRYEHGLTTLASGVRDQALIVEVGFDLR